MVALVQWEGPRRAVITDSLHRPWGLSAPWWVDRRSPGRMWISAVGGLLADPQPAPHCWCQEECWSSLRSPAVLSADQG